MASPLIGCLRHLKTNYLQILAAANREALAVAAASGLQFIRAEGFVFSHVADEGWMDACAGPLLRYRKSIGMEDKVAVVCDIKKKHSAHAVTGDVDIVETAKAARFFRSDGVIVTGASTGHEASPGELQAVLAGVPDLPVLVGSGVSAANLKSYRYRSLMTNTKKFSEMDFKYPTFDCNTPRWTGMITIGFPCCRWDLHTSFAPMRWSKRRRRNRWS